MIMTKPDFLLAMTKLSDLLFKEEGDVPEKVDYALSANETISKETRMVDLHLFETDLIKDLRTTRLVNPMPHLSKVILSDDLKEAPKVDTSTMSDIEIIYSFIICMRGDNLSERRHVTKLLQYCQLNKLDEFAITKDDLEFSVTALANRLEVTLDNRYYLFLKSVVSPVATRMASIRASPDQKSSTTNDMSVMTEETTTKTTQADYFYSIDD